MKRPGLKYCYLYLLFFCLSCQLDSTSQTTDASQKLTEAECNHPDSPPACCFVHMPPAVTNIMNIARSEEKGERMTISGTIYKADGTTPYANVLMYAYHTDITGNYTKDKTEQGIQRWHGKLHGWCRTDAKGRYEINSIRPAPYPGNKAPAHVHAVVQLPETGNSFYINDYVFDDDPNVNEQYKALLRNNQGGTGIIHLSRTNSTWTGSRDIILDSSTVK